MGILGRFDPFREAIINPTDFIQPVIGFPKTVVSTFSKRIVDKFVQTMGAKEIAASSGANGRYPVYGVPYSSTTVGFVMSPVGAPAAVALMEELIAMGGENFLYFGSCGVLQRSIAAGHFIVPSAAARDEGTSYHYLPAEDEIQMEEGSVAAVAKTLERLGYPQITGKTWTNDAIYRETRGKVHQRKKEGCIVVEMECAALAAVAQFRKVRYAAFYFADDNLDAPEWDPRTLFDMGLSGSDKYTAAAMECALALEAAK